MALNIIDVSGGGTIAGIKVKPNQFYRDRNAEIQGMVFHHTGPGKAANNINYSQNVVENPKHSGAQYYIDRDGTIYQYAPDTAAMGGIQDTQYRTDKNAPTSMLKNSNVINVELIASGPDDYTPAQIEAAKQFAALKQQEYKIQPQMIVGHGESQNRGEGGNRNLDEALSVVQAIRQQMAPVPATMSPQLLAMRSGVPAPGPAVAAAEQLAGASPASATSAYFPVGTSVPTVTAPLPMPRPRSGIEAVVPGQLGDALGAFDAYFPDAPAQMNYGTSPLSGISPMAYLGTPDTTDLTSFAPRQQALPPTDMYQGVDLAQVRDAVAKSRQSIPAFASDAALAKLAGKNPIPIPPDMYQGIDLAQVRDAVAKSRQPIPAFASDAALAKLADRGLLLDYPGAASFNPQGQTNVSAFAPGRQNLPPMPTNVSAFAPQLQALPPASPVNQADLMANMAGRGAKPVTNLISTIPTNTGIAFGQTPTGVLPAGPGPAPIPQDRPPPKPLINKKGFFLGSPEGTRPVLSGETLGKIAKSYDMTAKELAALNKIPNANKVMVGARLVVPIAKIGSGNVSTPTGGTLTSAQRTAIARSSGSSGSGSSSSTMTPAQVASILSTPSRPASSSQPVSLYNPVVRAPTVTRPTLSQMMGTSLADGGPVGFASGGQIVGTNGYVYEKNSSGGYTNVGKVAGMSDAQLYDAANAGAFNSKTGGGANPSSYKGVNRKDTVGDEGYYTGILGNGFKPRQGSTGFGSTNTGWNIGNGLVNIGAGAFGMTNLGLLMRLFNPTGYKQGVEGVKDALGVGAADARLPGTY